MRTATIDSLTNRLARVLALVTGHIDEPLPLDRLAAEAALSPFHFHRVWRAATGESVAETIRRLRLERAAHALGAGERPVTDIALDAGFQSSQAFAKAFREAAGVSPTEFRAARRQTLDGAPKADAAPLAIRIESIEPFRIVAARHVGPHDTITLAQAFGRAFAWAGEAGLMERFAGIYAVLLDDPRDTDEARYEAGLAVGPAEPPAPLAGIDIAGGAHAVLRIDGSWDQLPAAWDAFYGWLIESGHEPADAPPFQHFLDGPEVAEAERRTDLFVPLRA